MESRPKGKVIVSYLVAALLLTTAITATHLDWLAAWGLLVAALCLVVIAESHLAEVNSRIRIGRPIPDSRGTLRRRRAEAQMWGDWRWLS